MRGSPYRPDVDHNACTDEHRASCKKKIAGLEIEMFIEWQESGSSM
ncbi:MAG: hypothetical protein HY675_16015 [Chloroflexi bacterium]|nr:hypothetical protein [Chloroflexota bacterium]